MSIKSNQKPFPERDSSGKPLMTEEFICKLCEFNSGYSTPSYNFTCYLHFFGFSKIENLTNFTNLRVLYLENNHLQKIENLSHLTNLECLYLQHNYITKIENLEHNKALVNLNLSENKITKIENLSCLPS
jgi:dynein assembly factor 1